jgi:hypothetical protein
MIKFFVGVIFSSLVFIGVSIAKQVNDSHRDGIITISGYIIDTCPKGYFPHTFSAGDKYCLSTKALKQIGGIVF